MELLEKAFEELYPERKGYTFALKYGSLHGYNGRISMRWKHIECTLSRKWEPISDDIQMGMIQSLLVRIFKDKRRTTMNIDLYNSFVRNLHLAVPKTRIDPILKESFDRVNARYFDGGIEIANLLFSGDSARRLGSYNYKTDTIKISNIFRELAEKYLDYVMFHEMLHKKHKFYEKSGKTFHHTGAFKREERSFPGGETMEKELNSVLSAKLRERKRSEKRSFWDFF